jgi:hypothetical protein
VRPYPYESFVWDWEYELCRKAEPELTAAIYLLGFIRLLQLEGECDRYRCGGRRESPHPCPYAQEIGGDSETLCTCCDGCTYGCARDV